MIPLSKLLKERGFKTSVGVATDSAETACACDAAPKKPQTLQQHLKQYHGGKMPTGDCKFLKQYKKDHPDWQSEVPKPTKGESDIDTVKKDAKPKKGGDDDDLLGAELMDEIKKNPLFDVKSPKEGVFSVRRGKGIRAFDNMGWDILNEMKKTFGKDAIDSLGTPSVFDNYVQFSGVLPKKSEKQKKMDMVRQGKYRDKGAKKSAAEEYVDSVKKDAKKSEKKDGKSSDVRLPQYPSKEDMKKNFDFDKAEKTIMDSVSSTGDITDIDSDILGDGCLTLSFGLKKGSKFGKPAKELLGDALEKMGIPRSAMEDPIPGTRDDSAIVVVKLDALLKQNDSDDIESAESLIDNNSEDDLEAMFSDDSRKTCVDGARKQAAKTGDSYDVTWSPNTGWGFIKHYKGNLSKGQTVLGTVSNDFDDKGVRMGAQFHRNMDFDSKKPVERYKEIQAALDARKTALAKGESDNGDSGKGGSAAPVEYPKVVMDAVEKERAKAPVDDTDWTDEEADKFVELTDGIYQQDFDNTEVETHKGFAIVWNKKGAWRVELDKGKVTDLC